MSSTFDSIPFVRDYLQKEIEGQLRILFMDELPAIIHRLSLRLWVPEYRDKESDTTRVDAVSPDGPVEDPLLNPPQDPVDASGNVLTSSQIASLSLDSGVEMHSLFSQKNLLRLAALTDSQKTLSLFTPSIQQVVFRAWTGTTDQNDSVNGFISPSSPALSRTHSHVGSISHSVQESTSGHSAQSRLSLANSGFGGYGISLGAGRHSKAHAAKKRKKRVVDLRRPKVKDESGSVSGESVVTETDSAPSVFTPSPIAEEANDDPTTPPISPESTNRNVRSRSSRQRLTEYPQRIAIPEEFGRDISAQNNPQNNDRATEGRSTNERIGAGPSTIRGNQNTSLYPPEKSEHGESSSLKSPQSPSYIVDSSPTRSILEQAWMMKMAGEIARKIQDEKFSASETSSIYWDRRARAESPPPAYGQ